MAFASNTELVNASLSTLGEPEIRDFATDTIKTAVEARRWFNHTVDIELLQYDWPFAIRRAIISPDVTQPAFGWANRFEIPSDCIRFLPVTDDGEDTGNPVPHKSEDGHILCDLTSDMKLRYIVGMYDVTQWSPAFTDVMIAAMALRLVENITGLSQSITTATSRYEAAAQRARRFEGRQTGTAAPGYISDWFEDRVE